ncbi:MAG: hypothetical protein AAFY78_06630 [Cyanobacteria bacterium J06648_16]
MNDLNNVNKYVIGTILGLISLLVIYGASASNQVASWVDGNDREADLVSLNNDGARTVSQADSTPSDRNLTPLQKAGQLPQRQTIVEESAEGDQIRVQPLENAPTTQVQAQPTETTPEADPAPTVTRQPAQAENPEPVRALW